MVKDTIIIKPEGGLCNRLRVIMIYLEYVNQKNKKLKILWSADRPIDKVVSNTHFLDIFKPLPNASFVSQESSQNISYRGWGKGCGDLFRNILPNVEDRLLTLKQNYSLLKLDSKLQYKADGLARLHHPKGYASIHIRRTDHIKWLKEQSKEPVPYSAFESFIDSQANLPIYIATDNSKTQEYFKNKYGAKVFFYEEIKDVEDLRKTSLAHAAIDLYMCSRSAAFKGTEQSSFSDSITLLRPNPHTNSRSVAR
tara:strand:+ start:1409 stop:2167 length:759 start_codon:yes stop_codon:yes gene_type:complete